VSHPSGAPGTSRVPEGQGGQGGLAGGRPNLLVVMTDSLRPD
jgi:hypothetical protein